MPTLMLRGLPAHLAARLKVYADTYGLGRGAAAMQLLAIALDHLEARKASGQAAQAKRTPEERSEAARRAVTARWARARGEDPT